MPFEETTFRTARDGDVITATIYGASPHTLTLQITMSDEKAASLGIKVADRLRAFVGHGEDAGRVQIKVEPTGPCRARKSGRSYIAINCGHHASFDTPRQKAVIAQVRRRDTAIDIWLPADWQQKEFARGSGPKTNGVAPTKAAKNSEMRDSPRRWPHKITETAEAPKEAEEIPNINKAVDPPPAMPSIPEPDRTVRHNGVTVCFNLNAERVTYAGRSFPVSARQAHAVERLARSLGKQVGRSWLMNELFPGKKPAEVHMEFDKLILALKDAVQKVGLMLIEEPLRGGALMYSLMRKRS